MHMVMDHILSKVLRPLQREVTTGISFILILLNLLLGPLNLVQSIVSVRDVRMRMLSRAAYSLVSLRWDIVGFVMMGTLHSD